MEDQEVPQNTFIDASTMLQEYLNEYPEDILKWTEFMNDTPKKNRIPPRLRHLFMEILPNGEIHVQEDSPVTASPQAATSLTPAILRSIQRNTLPTRVFKEGCCGICDEPIGSLYSSTMPCGHTYHTDCFMAWDYEHGASCNILNCGVSPHAKVRAMFSELRRSNREGTTALVRMLQKRKSFRAACKEIRSISCRISKAHRKVQAVTAAERNKVLELHGDKLNQIQDDLNEIPKRVLASDAYKERKDAVREGRALMRMMYRVYRMGLRDLIDQIGLRVSWETRWILERHRVHDYFGGRRAGIRMSPGGRRSWKPSERKKKTAVNVETDDDSEYDSEA